MYVKNSNAYIKKKRKKKKGRVTQNADYSASAELAVGVCLTE